MRVHFTFIFMLFLLACSSNKINGQTDELPLPTITSVYPTNGKASDTIIIKGQNFNTNFKSNTIRFAGGAEAVILNSTPTLITAIIPHKARSGNIIVKRKYNESNRVRSFKGPFFKINLPKAPIITSMSPTNGLVGTVVTISGENFSNISSNGLRFNNLVIPILKRAKSYISAKIPEGTTTNSFELIDSFYQKTTTTEFRVEPPVNFKIAFFADSGIGPDADKVLELIKSEGAQAVVHPGDLDYKEVPVNFEENINTVLGPNFPYFYCIGNHDQRVWEGSNGYQLLLQDRFRRLKIPWEGRLGVNSSFSYQGIQFVSSAPDELGTTGIEAGKHISTSFTKTKAIWNISFWHKNQTLMQIGGKTNQAGWEVYEASRKAGALIATGHEHSYSRTHEMSDFISQEISNTNTNISIVKDNPTTKKIDEGRTFAFVSGIGGKSLRSGKPELLAKPWWANVYHKGNGSQHGALFGEFNYNGDLRLSRFYFKDIDGNVRDEFFVRSKN